MIETQPFTLRNLLDFDFAPAFQRLMETLNIVGYIVIACLLLTGCILLAKWWWTR